MSNIDFLTTFSRIFVQINDENRLIRKQSLEKILNHVLSDKSLENDFFIFSKIISSIFDAAERNREITCEILKKIISRNENLSEFLPVIIPEFVKKLGDKDKIEPSEEIRYLIMQICLLTIQKSGREISVFIQDIIKLCCNTLTDNYSEIKRMSCSIINSLALLKEHSFYVNSEPLIKPLISNLCHQHSKVRLDMVICIGNVLLNSNCKEFDNICSNLAQRLFDDNSNVRKAVIEVFGKWLLDLTDRYSFHSKLIPVFLSGYIDTNEEIQLMTNDYWYDIGMKYQTENEADLKDRIDFELPNLTNYPKEYERPNLGCRVLLNRTMSRILPALTRDLADWSENTRIKAAQLLPYLIINSENSCTQHCQLFIGSTLIRGLVDEEEQVRRACRESSRLLGYFVEPKIWWHIFQNVINRCDADDTFVAGEIILLSCLVESSQSFSLLNEKIINEICKYLKSDDVCGSFSTKIKFAGLRCLLNIITRFDYSLIEVYDYIGYDLFYVAISLAAFETHEPNEELTSNLNNQLQLVFDKFTSSLSLDSQDDLFRKYIGSVLEELIPKSHNFSTHSSDRIMCSKLLTLSGSIIGEFVDQAVELFEIALDKNKELELRLKFFVTLVKLTSNINLTLNSKGLFQKNHLERLLNSSILPNLMWQSGRTAEALRRIAITCLWSTLVGCCKSATETGQDNVFSCLPASIWHDLLVRQVAALDDDLKDTRMCSAKCLAISLDIVGQYDLISKNLVSEDYLHNIYPSFIKALNDVFDEIRIIVTEIIISWVKVLKHNFDINLYKAHIEDLNSGLLIHLDDQNRQVQACVFKAMLAVGSVCPTTTISEILNVRDKHRSPKYCDDLVAQIRLLKF